ncbi:hypothetical protein ACFLVX_04065 [Chloroflexota bacterium]
MLTARVRPEVRVRITPGPVKLPQERSWKRFWQKLIAEAKSEAAK